MHRPISQFICELYTDRSVADREASSYDQPRFRRLSKK